MWLAKSKVCHDRCWWSLLVGSFNIITQLIFINDDIKYLATYIFISICKYVFLIIIIMVMNCGD